ncbi:sulfatase family protein [Chitinophaga japonensis]|uniref:Arylsulfatase A-like enzyme n=1 Tax=Chitinophaga japonensis TaxID=104662 RepID=A0A562TH63_CHIJA|nr:sulfatase [Chitinophaga japonensis]TWI92316.1 arylsulfatase A-like enzyme [Chitinophaga japonensis]
MRKVMKHRAWLLAAVMLLPALPLLAQQGKKAPMNIIFILSDDHRYDAMGFMHTIEGLQTPGMDRMAREGAHLRNAFVSTALCSPSRASILTGQYAHTHTVVDNDSPMPDNLVFFPQYMQKQGYQTAFFGKWHMGNTGDQPQPGFDHWESFQGQGTYYNPVLNIDGKRIKQPEGSYTTDLLTAHTIEWLNKRNKQKPFFVYLSHKGVHAEFKPAKRHEGKYANIPIVCPPSMYLTVTDSSKSFGTHTAPATPVNYRDIPQWVRRQRYSWHGVDYMYHGTIVFDDFYRRYLETLQAVDESVERVLDWVKEQGLEENTMVVYMGDNGFSFGEHGLIDKRHAYEESMRVPLLCWAPGLVKAGTRIPEIIMNIDIAPTFLDLAGIPKPAQMQGQSFTELLRGHQAPWRDKVFYEYYWEAAFPQTPTIFAVRTGKYKYIYNHGLWDINELYDMEKDPYEMNNLIRNKAYEQTGKELRSALFNWLDSTRGLLIPLKKPAGTRFDNLYRGTY